MGIVRRSSKPLGRPRSPQSALMDLSSLDTKYLLKTLAELPHDIAHLNATGSSTPQDDSKKPLPLVTTSTQVFGWRNCFLSPRPSADSPVTPTSNHMIWKARKVFEATVMKSLAMKVWDSVRTLSDQPSLTKIRKWEHVYKVSEFVHVVRRVDCLYGRDERETMWLECLLDRGDHFCIGRKQLAQFRDYGFDDAEAGLIDDCECEGFLFRPHSTKLRVDNEKDSDPGEAEGKPSNLMFGSTLQCVSSIAPRGLSTEQLLCNLIADLPQFTLQWEEAVVDDLLAQIKF